MKRILICCSVFYLLLALFAGACSKSTDPGDKVARPVFEPPAGNYGVGQTISINCATNGASIHYTTDGSEPDGNSALYNGPISLSGAFQLRAKGYKEGLTPSGTTAGHYVIAGYTDSFVHVNGGSFHNGTAEVTLSSYLISKYETTQGSYEAVMGSNPAQDNGESADYPVYSVNWFDTIIYCNKRSIQEGFEPCYSYDSLGTNPDEWPDGWNVIEESNQKVYCNWSANGYRLPTEAEWEYAARGGSLSHGYTYSGGNDPLLVGWISENSYGTPHPVGQKLPNELGIYDMCGNLQEWCWDYYGFNYANYPQTDPHGPSTGEWRIVRDGSWRYSAQYAEIRRRDASLSRYRTPQHGFRVCRKI